MFLFIFLNKPLCPSTFPVLALLIIFPFAMLGQILEFGPPLIIESSFVNPYGLGIDDSNDRLLIANSGAHRIMFSALPGMETNPTWSEFGYVEDRTLPEALNAPQGIVIDANGHAYVVDAFNNEVKLYRWNAADNTYSYDPNFASITRNSVAGVDILLPRDAAVGPNGAIYLLDSGNDRILVADGASDNSWQVWGNNLEWGNPYGIDVGPDGSIYIADTDNHRIVKISNGVETYFGFFGTGNAQFRYPRDVAVGEDGKIYIADTYNHRIAILKPDGSHYRNLGGGPLFGTIQKIEVDSENRIFVIDSDKNRLVAFLGPNVAPPFDPYIRDYLDDTGEQPSSSEFALSSPDMLIRHSPDIDLRMATETGLATFGFQQPRYEKNNYIYLEVKNRGTSPAYNTAAKLYWIDPQSAQNFPQDWNSTGFYNYFISEDYNLPRNHIFIPFLEAATDPNDPETHGSIIVGPIVWRPPAPESGISSDGLFHLGVRLLNFYDPSQPEQGLDQIRTNNNIAIRKTKISRGPFPIGVQHTLVVGVRFPDINDTPADTTIMAKVEATGNWVKEVSYDLTTIDPIYRSWVTLDNIRSYYNPTDEETLMELTSEVLMKLLAVDPETLNGPTSSREDDIGRVILVLNDPDFSADWATTGHLPFELESRRHLSVSVQSYEDDIFQFAHGFSHQLGLQDLFPYEEAGFPADFKGADGWDNMAKPFNGVHPLAWSKEQVNWISSKGGKIHFIPRPAGTEAYTDQTSILLSCQSMLERGQTAAIAIGLSKGVATFEEEDHFFWIEARKSVGNADTIIKNNGVLIYHVEESIPQGQAPIIIQDYGLNTVELDDAAFPAGQSYSPAGTGITISVVSEEPGNGGYQIQTEYDPPDVDQDVYIAENHEGPVSIWTRQFGSSTADFLKAIHGTNSDVFVTGETLDTLPGQTSLGSSDSFVRKYDSFGNEVWTRQFGTSKSDNGEGIYSGTEGIYVVGNTFGEFPDQTSSGNSYIRKYDFAGQDIWTRQFGSSVNESATSVFSDNMGIYMAGYLNGSLLGQISQGLGDAYVRKYDYSGQEIWTRQFGTNGSDLALSICFDNTNVYVAGRAFGILPDQEQSGCFVRKYDPAGQEIWTRQFGIPNNAETAYGVRSHSGGVFVVGYVNGALEDQTYAGMKDAFVRKYDHDGNEIWTRQFGTEGEEDAREISVDDSGIYIAGNINGSWPGEQAKGGNDVYIRKYAVDGNLIWTRQFGTSDDDNLGGIYLDATGFYIAGSTKGSFHGKNNQGLSDAFVRRYAFDGVGESENIWVDSPLSSGGYISYNEQTKKSTGPVNENGVSWENNRVYARIFNGGSSPVYNFEVQFHITAPYQRNEGTDNPTFSKSIFIDEIAANDYQDVYVVWKPEEEGDPYYQIRVELRRLTNDPNTTNNRAKLEPGVVPGEDRPRLITHFEILPYQDPGKFNLLVDGQRKSSFGYEPDTGNKGTRAVYVSPGIRTLGLSSGALTSINNYIVLIGGDCAAAGTVYFETNSQVKTCDVKILAKSGKGACLTRCAESRNNCLDNGGGSTCIQIFNACIRDQCGPLPQQPHLDLTLEVQPPEDPGKFNLKIDGIARASNIGDGGSTGPVNVNVGRHIVSVTAGTNTELENYTVSYSEKLAPEGTVLVTATPIFIPNGYQIPATVKVAGTQLTLKSRVLPVGDLGVFNLLVDGITKVLDIETGETVIHLSPGVHTVSVMGGTGTNLDDYTTTLSGDCSSDGTVTLAYGDNKTCQITNTASSPNNCLEQCQQQFNACLRIPNMPPGACLAILNSCKARCQ